MCKRATTRLFLLGAAWLCSGGSALGATVAAQPGRVSLSQSAYVSHENQGYLAITIRRTSAGGEESVGYGVRQASALNGKDFVAIPNSVAHFRPGQYTFTFRVHIYDLGMNAPPLRATAYLFGARPQSLGVPHQANITLLRDDALQTRNPANPLELAHAPTNGNPLENARFYVAGSSSPAGVAAQALRASNPSWASALSVIATAPTARRFWFWNEPDPSKLVAGYLEYTQFREPGTAVQLSTYSLVHGHCTGHWSDPPSLVDRYRRWIDLLARGIGNFRVVMFFEMDALITAGCLSHHGLDVRLGEELHWAIDRLEQDPHLVLYVDGGAADALPWQRTASLLDRAGIHDAQGFFLNSTHFDWTTSELYYGQRIARALGGVHFVINTGESGRGPLVPANRASNGNEVLCNPPGRGLGPLTTNTGYKWADAFLWFGLAPGESGGDCRPGAPPVPDFWPAYAVMLVRNAVYRVTGPKRPLIRAGSLGPQLVHR